MEKEDVILCDKRCMFERYMLCVGIGGQLLYYFQAFHIFSYQSAKDISLVGFTINSVALASWLTYGFILKNKVMIAANVVGLTGALLVLLGTLLYG